jgi:acyl dehydratase
MSARPEPRELPAADVLLTREDLRRYAEASGDDNPIHLDDAAARRVGLPGVVVHGMLMMARLGAYAEAALGWGSPRAFRVRFRSPVEPDRVVHLTGRVKAPAADDPTVWVVELEATVEGTGKPAITGVWEGKPPA